MNQKFRHSKKTSSMLKLASPVLILLLTQDASSVVNALHFMNLQDDPVLQNADQILPGHCPNKPGDLKSNLSTDFDLAKLEGVWRNIYDEKALNE